MKKQGVFFLIIILSWFSQIEIYAQDEAQDKIAEINFNTKKSSYINFIDSYISHINLNSKDRDEFNEDEKKSINAAKGFKHNSAQKRVIYRNNKIVKVKYIDFLDNNFIKLKSFYYHNNHLVCVRINELLPSKTKNTRTYKRTLYYNNNELLFDSKHKDNKYSNEFLWNLGQEKLQEEYQSKLDV
jgi:hypothetical protein